MLRAADAVMPRRPSKRLSHVGYVGCLIPVDERMWGGGILVGLPVDAIEATPLRGVSP